MSGERAARTGGAERPDRFGAFVSYRHTDPDRRWAKWLHAQLEAYRVPGRLVASGAPERIGRIFRDEEELPASSDLSQRIDEALSSARFLIVVCSPRTPASQWVDEEVRRFQALGGADRVLALLIEGDPAQSFPPALRDREPLAADVRPAAGESRRVVRKTALLKLLAGMLGVPYDDLRRRDEERARRRLAWLAGGATGLALVLLGLSLFAWNQWQRAERELRVSRAQALAVQAQIAYVTTPESETPGAAGIERGILLALESLDTFPSLEGDQALRAGLRKLGRSSLEIVVEEAELAGAGPQGRWLLLQTEAGPRLFDVATRTYRDAPPIGTTPAPTPGTGGPVLARSRDGRLELASSEEGAAGWVHASAVLRRTQGGETLAVLPHEWMVRFAAFSPDARWLVTVTDQASRDAEDVAATALVGSTVRVWEVYTGRKVTEVSLAWEGGIGQLALSPDGGWLATQLAQPKQNVVLLWPLWPATVRAEACKRLTRNLSPSEWLTFVGVQPQRSTCPGLPRVSE